MSQQKLKAILDSEIDNSIGFLETETTQQRTDAVSFYLRCVEYANNGDLKAYTSLLRMSQCFNDQQGREYSVTNCLLQAIACDDTRPEAYLLLSQFYEKAQQWQECYTWATLGLGWSRNYFETSSADIGYYGDYCLRFQIAISAWWIGRKTEALDIFNALAMQDNLHPMYKNAITYNLEKLNALL
jgi:hypothetical protein